MCVKFIKYRCETHHVILEEYKRNTLEPLELLLKGQFDNIALWFDEDMFCQINYLTILAYLEQINFTGEIKLNLVNYNFEVIASHDLNAKGYLQIFKQVMIDKSMPRDITLSALEKGIKLYLEYLKEDNVITEYIKKHKDLTRDMLVRELLKSFPEYGLGDTQYFELIDGYR